LTKHIQISEVPVPAKKAEAFLVLAERVKVQKAVALGGQINAQWNNEAQKDTERFDFVASI
jgi:hypothetical protein